MQKTARVLLRLQTRDYTCRSADPAGVGPMVELVQFCDGCVALLVGGQEEGHWPAEQVERGVQALWNAVAG